LGQLAVSPALVEIEQPRSQPQKPRHAALEKISQKTLDL
jgi:hypothetical protein